MASETEGIGVIDSDVLSDTAYAAYWAWRHAAHFRRKVKEALALAETNEQVACERLRALLAAEVSEKGDDDD